MHTLLDQMKKKKNIARKIRNKISRENTVRKVCLQFSKCDKKIKMIFSRENKAKCRIPT